jgi:hypothetical protein
MQFVKVITQWLPIISGQEENLVNGAVREASGLRVASNTINDGGSARSLSGVPAVRPAGALAEFAVARPSDLQMVRVNDIGWIVGSDNAVFPVNDVLPASSHDHPQLHSALNPVNPARPNTGNAKVIAKVAGISSLVAAVPVTAAILGTKKAKKRNAAEAAKKPYP